MKFHLAINLERMSPATDMKDVRDHVQTMVEMADAAGFEIVETGNYPAAPPSRYIVARKPS